MNAQQTRGIYSMLFQCCPIVFDAGPTLKQHWINTPCLLVVTLACQYVSLQSRDMAFQ